MKQRTIHVFVLGSLVQSPRILSHARYLAREGWSVTISGYLLPTEKILDATNMVVIPLPSCSDFRNYVHPAMLALFLKFLVTSFLLLCHVVRHCRSRVVLLQNPPAVPAFLVLWVFVVLTRKRLIIDWHNYGYTLMELNDRRGSLSSRIYRRLEVDFARLLMTDSRQFRHFCVSRALEHDLFACGIEATVVYDRASEDFKNTMAPEAHELFSRLASQYPAFADPEGSLRRTRFTEITALPTACGGSQPQWRVDRPALIVSSCSWTADDDFALIVDALELYDIHASSERSSQLPRIMFVVTGRGPLKSYFKQIIEMKRWTHIEVLMPWLEWTDYPVFLGCADLGISVHRSSSGLDLPMKVVDLIGVEVPVLALTYPTLHELVPEGEWGNHFADSTQLSTWLIRLLTPACPRRSDDEAQALANRRSLGSKQLAVYQHNLRAHNERILRGYQYWTNVALPVFERALDA